MEIFDIIVLVFIGYGLVTGFSKGFIVEVSGLLALFIGIYGAFRFSDILSLELSTYVDWDPKTIQITSFFLLFVGCVYLISLFAKMLTKVLKLVALGFVNRLLGATFGALKMTIILCTLIMAYMKVSSIITLIPGNFLENSVSYEPLLNVGEFLFDWMLENSDKIPNDLKVAVH